MKSWTEARIRDVARTFDGPHATPKSTKTASSGPIFLGISSLDRGRLDLDRSAFISEEDLRSWTRRVAPTEGDVVFSYETRLGEAALIPEGFRGALGRRLALMRPDRSKVDPRYLLYYFLGPSFQEVIRQNTVQGSTVDRISLSDFPDFPIFLPSLPEQHFIAATLGALDDKVESNRRIARVCLDLAGATYLRACKTGSRQVALKDTGRWLSGGTPSTSRPEFWGGDLPWISSASMKDFFIADSERRLTASGAAAATCIVPRGSVIFVVRGMSLKTEFRVGLTQVPVAFGQDCKAILPEIPAAILAVALWVSRGDVLELVDEAGHGTGRLSTDLLEQFRISVPQDSSLAGTLAVLIERGAVANQECRRLEELRDTLLPELLAGRFSVRESAGLVDHAATRGSSNGES